MTKKTYLGLFFLGILLITYSSCYLTRAIRFRKFELKDIDKLESITLTKSSTPYSIPENLNKYPTISHYLDSMLTDTYTYSFMVIRNDTIVYEKYFGEVTADTRVPSFSVAKSFVSTLVEIAHEEGKIKSLSEPVTNYIPELLKSDKRFANVTIQHVLDMRSGIKSSENYSNPSSHVLKMGFTSKLWPIVKRIKIQKAPGTLEYKSANTQLLGIIVERATGKKLQDYLQKKIWEPLGMQSDATWNIDNKKDQMVKAFCCINATTKDFAKLGLLFLHNGNWNGQQIVSEKWVKSSTSPDTMLAYQGYKNQWWGKKRYKAYLDSTEAVNKMSELPYHEPRVIPSKWKGDKVYYFVPYYTTEYYAEGILGQFVYVHPDKNLVMVRTGHYWKHPKYGSVDSFLHHVGKHVFHGKIN